MSTNMPVIERFLSYVRLDESGCWLWIGGVSHNGYGRFKLDYQNIRAHRFSYAYFISDVPGHMVVRHKCNVPACVNPFHLLLGTHLDNIKDRQDQDRQAKGSSNGSAVLTEEQVMKIKTLLSMGASVTDTAELFGVGTSTISGIKNGISWRHV